MPIETSDDRLIFLADFGVTVTYTYQGGGSVSFTAILDNAYEAVDVGGNVPFAMLQPRIFCRTEDVPSAADGDTAVISGVTYNVRVVMKDGTGMTEMMLEVA